jgi:alpha-L-arabinofuranosidase
MKKSLALSIIVTIATLFIGNGIVWGIITAAEIEIIEITDTDIAPSIIGTNLHAAIEGRTNAGLRKNQVMAKNIDGSFSFNPEVKLLSKQAGFSIYRFPGGTNSDFYHWFDGIGNIDSRKKGTDAYGKEFDNIFGTTEFLSFATEQNADAIITANYKNASAQEAANWVEFCNGIAPSTPPCDWTIKLYSGDEKAPKGYFAWLRKTLGYPTPFNVKYWEIGNEIYIHKDSNYLNSAEGFCALMKEVDPSIKIGVSGDSTLYLSEKEISKISLNSCFDFIVIHYYSRPRQKGGITKFYSNAISRRSFESGSGDYTFEILAKGTKALGSPEMEIMIDDFKTTMEVDSDDYQVYKFSCTLTEGIHNISLEFLNDRSIPGIGDRNLFVKSIKMSGLNISDKTITNRGDRKIFIKSIKVLEQVDKKEIWSTADSEYKALFANNLLIEQHIELIKEKIPGFDIFVTEGNTGYGIESGSVNAKEDLKLKSSLWVAGLLNSMIRKNIPVFCQWLLYDNWSGFGLIRPEGYVAPSYYVLKLYSIHRGNKLVNLSVKSNTFDSPLLETTRFVHNVSNVPFVDAVSSYNQINKELIITVINRNWTESVEVVLKHNNHPIPIDSMMLSSLNAISGGMDASNEDQQDNVIIRDLSIQVNNILLPPHSITNITIPNYNQ